MGATVTGRARLYQTVRTAHLERALALAPATIFYSATRYDFDRTLAGDLDLVPAGPVRAAWLLARSGVRQLEVNEPLMLQSLPRTALAVAVLRLRYLIGGPRTHIVSYAIENADPFERPVSGRARLSRRAHRLLSGFVWSSLDRVAFGTESAQRTYRAAFSGRPGPARSAEIPALPAPCTCQGQDVDDTPRLLFLGALTGRKGFPQLLDAWLYLKVRLPNARLTILGTGPMSEQAQALAAADPAVEVHINPGRAEIHAHLRRSTVLVLPSQPMPEWREQVGLPICEGLAHGCTVVTSTETGLAAWLAEHGHTTLNPSVTPDDWAHAIDVALRHRRSRDSVLADLPEVDGRLAADDWLFGS